MRVMWDTNSYSPRDSLNPILEDDSLNAIFNDISVARKEVVLMHDNLLEFDQY